MKSVITLSSKILSGSSLQALDFPALGSLVV